MRGTMNGFVRRSSPTSPSAVQAEYERRNGIFHDSKSAPDAVGGRTVADGSGLYDAPRETAGAGAEDVQRRAASVAATLKDQASETIGDARATVVDLAAEARARVRDLIDRQKAAGADRLDGMARAAKAAAGDFETSSPDVARLVRGAAGGVERIAVTLRNRSLEDIVADVDAFGRRRPAALFGGAVLVGFALMRFLKTEPTKAPVAADTAAPSFSRSEFPA